MGLFKRIKGILGIPNYVSGTFKSVVIDDDGNLAKKTINGLPDGTSDSQSLRWDSSDGEWKANSRVKLDDNTSNRAISISSSPTNRGIYIDNPTVGIHFDAVYTGIIKQMIYVENTYYTSTGIAYILNELGQVYQSGDTSYGDNAGVVFFEERTNGTNYIKLKAPSSLSGNTTFNLPSADGTANQVMKTDGSGNLGWATPSSGEANTGVNVGGEKEVYKSMSGTALQFRTLKEGTNVTLTQNTNDITIDVAGGGFWDGYVVVTADESNTTTTLVDSSYLTIPLDATSTYLVKAVVYMDDASSSKELRGNFAYTGSIDYSGIKIYNSTSNSNILTSSSFYLFNKPKGYMIEVTGMITTTTSGNLKVQFRLGSGTGTVYLRKGSILYYKKVL